MELTMLHRTEVPVMLRWPWQTRKHADCLFAAVGEADADEVRRLLLAGADPNYVEESGDITVLMIAASGGRLDIVELLIEAGADPNAMAEDLSGDLDRFSFLDDLFAQAKLHAMFPLAYAALYGHQSVYDYLAPLTSAKLRRQAEEVQHARQAAAAGKHSTTLSETEKSRGATRTTSRAGEELLNLNPKLA